MNNQKTPKYFNQTKFQLARESKLDKTQEIEKISESLQRIPKYKGNKENIWNEIMKLGGTVIISKSLFAPLERTKIIMQTQHEAVSIKSNMIYKPLKILNNIWKYEGTRGLFRGNLTNICKNFVTVSIQIHFYTHIREYIIPNPIESYSVTKYSILSTISSLLTACLSFPLAYPLEVIQTRISGDAGPGHPSRHSPFNYKSLPKSIYSIIGREGPQGLYRGLLFTSLTAPIYYSLLIPLFHSLSNILSRSQSQSLFMLLKEKLGAAAIAPIFVGLCLYPLDTIRRCIQIRRPPLPTLWTGIKSAALNIYIHNGFTGFYKGIALSLCKNIPIVYIQFTLYELATSILNTDRITY